MADLTWTTLTPAQLAAMTADELAAMGIEAATASSVVDASLRTAITGDWAFIDTIETVILDDVSASVTVSAAKGHKEDISFKEAMLGGSLGLEGDSVAWVLWDATLSSVTPERGDTITDSGAQVWTIVSISQVTIAGTVVKYRCLCNKQR